MERPLALVPISPPLKRLAKKFLAASPLLPLRKLMRKPGKSWDDFYREFELRFRGNPDDLMKRLRENYQPVLVSHLMAIEKRGKAALDLGCGHGEFLCLLQETGFNAWGVDQSRVAVRQCLSQGLQAVRRDILRYLKSCPSGSQALISCTHVMEHCPPGFNFQLVREAFRCLIPGGLLILETPSLFSLWAGARQFYLDPTHQTPVHPEYLRFLCEFHGFVRTEIKEQGEVLHPLRGHQEQRDTELLKKWDSWLFGPMDLCCLAFRPEQT